MKTSTVTLFLLLSIQAFSTSVSNPNSPTENLPLGVVFQIQAGPFDQPIPDSAAGFFAAATVVSTSDGDHYFFGPFTDFRAVTESQNKLAAHGLNKGSVQSFFNRKPVALKDAFILLDNQNAFEATESFQEASVPVSELESLIDAGFGNQSVVFSVQLGVVKDAPLVDAFTDFGTVELEVTASGLHRYSIGKYSSFEEARLTADEIKRSGQEGAFVVAFINGQRAGIDLARQVQEHLDEDVAILSK